MSKEKSEEDDISYGELAELMEHLGFNDDTKVIGLCSEFRMFELTLMQLEKNRGRYNINNISLYIFYI